MSRTVRGVRRQIMFCGEVFCTRGAACHQTHRYHDLENYDDHAALIRPPNDTLHPSDDIPNCGEGKKNLREVTDRQSALIRRSSLT